MEELYYSKDHEWVRFEGEDASIGISDYAQKALGEIVFLDMPEVGAEVKPGDTLGAVESVKSVSDIYAPVGGTVVETNGALEDDPGAVNRAPCESWIVRLHLAGPADRGGLMDAAAYQKYCEEEQN